MKEDSRLLKVEILIQQEKYSEAEKVLADLLAEDSNNVYYQILLAEVYLQQKDVDKANKVIENAIGIVPDLPQLYYYKTRIAIKKRNITEAEKYIRQAIKLDPDEADYLSLLADIKMTNKQFDQALKFVNQALEIDPENIMALNTRSKALMMLNRGEESFQTIESALKDDPNNAYTHANYGWSLLQNGNHKKSLQHFKEALSNDPSFEYAQLGMLEALKATNPIYRIFLKYSLWMSKQTSKFRWGIIIGYFILIKILKTITKSNEAFEPYLLPLIFTLAFIAFSTWVVEPISNLFLRFNKYGKLLMGKKEKMSSTLVAGSFCIFILGIILYFISSDIRMMTIAVFGFTMMPPLSIMLYPVKNKYALSTYTITLGAIGIIAIILTFAFNNIFNIMSGTFIIGFLGFQWIANAVLAYEND